MTEDHTVLLRNLRTDKGCRPIHLLYYYQGNFYHPPKVHKKDLSRMNAEMKYFERDNLELVRSDQGHPDYKTKAELFDEQMEEA